ncbi:MAG: helicase-related protein, partial [Euzebya sp.]
TDTILVGTIDIMLSRAVNRGYAMGNGSWPIDFGLVGNDIQWVFDEVQLMGPALVTSRQLQVWRDRFGTFGPTASMWMSATLDLDRLNTVDAPAPTPETVVTLDREDLADQDLRGRVQARRQVGQVQDGRSLTAAIRDHHRPGTRTIVFHNTVMRAQQTFADLSTDAQAAEVVLIHSRFRPPEREAAMARVLMEPGPEGAIVVTTQALEAGVDITSACLFTELAPWSSIVHRAEPCNRYGEQDDARLLWFEPEAAPPYEQDAIAASRIALTELDGTRVTGQDLAMTKVAEALPLHATIRRKDLVDLFDTAPDLSGNDIDVSQFIREDEEVDVRFVWRQIVEGARAPKVLDKSTPAPTRNEMCAVPISVARKAAKKDAVLWRFDTALDRWVQCERPRDVVPGSVRRSCGPNRRGRTDDPRQWRGRPPDRPQSFARHSLGTGLAKRGFILSISAWSSWARLTISPRGSSGRQLLGRA